MNGAIVIANIYTSLHAGLISPVEAKTFIEQCASSTAEDAGKQFQQTSILDEPSKLRFVLLKLIDLSAADPNERWSNVVTGSIFLFHLLSRAYKANPSGSFSATVLPREPFDDRDDNIWAETLTYFATHDIDWAVPGKHLGRPFDAPAGDSLKVCWVTKQNLITEAVAPHSSYSDRANAVRDKLGLIHYRPAACLVQLNFPVHAIQSASPALRVAQPNFCDAAGHSRFAANQPGATCSDNRKLEWGTTVDLARFASGDTDLCGLPERVSDPVPIDTRVVKPAYIGRLTVARGDSRKDGDDTFVEWLCRTVALSDMIDYIVNVIV